MFREKARVFLGMKRGLFIDPSATIGEGTTWGCCVVIGKNVSIGKNCHIGDFCIILGNVTIGDGTFLCSNVCIYGHGATIIGRGNRILDGCVIGNLSECIGYHTYSGNVVIGDNNYFGSYCKVSCGNNFCTNEREDLLVYSTEKDQYQDDATIIGDRCFISSNVIIHHNCHIGLGKVNSSRSKDYDTIIGSGCILNGFVHIYKGCVLSSGVLVHEWMTIGSFAFVEIGERIVKNVPPYAKISENRYIQYSQISDDFGYENGSARVDFLVANFDRVSIPDNCTCLVSELSRYGIPFYYNPMTPSSNKDVYNF